MGNIFLALVVLFLAGCAAQSPVLYPNEHLKGVGDSRAQIDIEECSRQAESYVRANPGAKVVGSAVVAVTGHIGRGALVGGVAGAATGLVRGIYKSSQPSPVYKAFVNRCLRDKGYDPIGWE